MCDCCNESPDIDFDDLLNILFLKKDYARRLCGDAHAEIARLRAELAQALGDMATEKAITSQLRTELASAITGQVCGHAFRFIQSSDGGTGYCQACEDESGDVNELDREIDCLRLRAELAQAHKEIATLTKTAETHKEVESLMLSKWQAELAQAREIATSLARDNAKHCAEIERKDAALNQALPLVAASSFYQADEVARTMFAALSPLPEKAAT
jgi:hypothetical protein